MYKVLALDMDGTLLNSNKVISSKTKEALHKAKDNGVKIVLASGRPIDGLKKYLKELDLIHDNQYVLSYNGCLVQETKSEKIIHEMGLKGKDLHDIYKLSLELGVNIHAFSPERGLITPKISKYTEVEAELNGIDINVCDFNKIKEDESIIKIMFIDEAEILDRVLKEIPKELFDRYNIVKSTPYFLEFINKNGNKGVGLHALAKHMNITNKEIIACGDAANDLEMLEYAGFGVAMGNAIKEIKEASSFVTSSNNEDGIARVINKYIL